MMTIKRYSLINKNTGTTITRSFTTRAAARQFKASNNFRYRIFDNVSQTVVR